MARSTALGPIGRVTKRFTRRQVMETSTVRDFGGGWNVIDSELNLSSRYAPVLRNISRQPDGSNGLRPGTKYFADVSSAVSSVLTGDILNITYFNNFLIAFTDTGQGCKINGLGVATKIWDTAIAASLPGAPIGWSTDLVVVNFAQFKGELIVVNGTDKPLLIGDDMAITYLQDLGTGSNINVPIAKYITVVGEWVIMAGLTTGDPEDEGSIYISNTQTSGTWPGDVAPNNGVVYQVFAAASIGEAAITGLGSYRGKLLVTFKDVTIIVALGTFNETTNFHDPRIEDTFPQYGCLSHRSIAVLGDDFLLADAAGVPSFVRSTLSGSLEPTRASELIDPEFQRTIAAIVDEGQLNNIFAVYHRLASRYMVFVPNGNDWDSTTETRCFVYYAKRSKKTDAWSEFTGWNWRAATRSDGGRVFFADAGRIYILADQRFNDEYYADKIGYFDSLWAVSVSYVVGNKVKDGITGTIYNCLINHTSAASGSMIDDVTMHPTFWEVYEGVPIDFDWEFPWVDFKKRMNVKELRYIQFDTEGNAQFTCEAYLDNIRVDEHGNDNPALSIQLTGGTSQGFGDGDQPYGGGRRAGDERPWAFSHKFKILKLRIKGSTTASLGLRVISVSVGYVTGSVLR
jgi:hypothetical protein